MGRTPLYRACQLEHLQIVRYLVEKGANKNAKDNNGKTPYDVEDNDEIKKILDGEGKVDLQKPGKEQRCDIG